MWYELNTVSVVCVCKESG